MDNYKVWQKANDMRNKKVVLGGFITFAIFFLADMTIGTQRLDSLRDILLFGSVWAVMTYVVYTELDSRARRRMHKQSIVELKEIGKKLEEVKKQL